MNIVKNFKSDRVYRSGEEIMIGDRWYLVFNRYRDESSKHYGNDYCALDAIVFSLAGKPLGEAKVSRIEINEESLMRAQNRAANSAIAKFTGEKIEDVGSI